MNDDKKPLKIEEVEIEALSDEDLETIAGGAGDSVGSSSCCSNFAASCGCKAE